MQLGISQNMVIFHDVDKVLTRHDLEQFYIDDATWPWPMTHFILSDKCFGCQQKINNSTRLQHFTLKMTKTDIWNLLQCSNFWCFSCNYVVYDHFTPDECDFCNLYA